MTEKNQDYHEALEDYASQKIDYVFIDISEELDNIERTLETEASKILINSYLPARRSRHQRYPFT